MRALVLGDLLQTALLRVRPYEKEPGGAERLYRTWLHACADFLNPPPGQRIRKGYRVLVREIVSAFSTFDFDKSHRKPRVGLVGEILVKFHPDANNHAVDVIESEGCEACVPGLLDFFLYSFRAASGRFGTWAPRS